jgi:hypothetical protein
MRKNLRNLEVSGAIFSIVVGAMLHFLYEWSGSITFVGLFSAVNESVWEHTKLFFFPLLIFMAVELYFQKDKKRVLLAKVMEALFGLTFIISFYYTYTGVFGKGFFVVDILSFIVAVLIGKFISYKIISSKVNYRGYIALHVAVLILLTIFFFTATFIPPKIPLFQDKNNGQYGIENNKGV